MKWLRIIKKSILFAIPLVVVALSGWALRSESDFFIVDQAQVEVQFQEGQAAIVDLLREEIKAPIQATKGKNIWSLDLSNLREQLLENPWVDDVELRRRFPNKITSLVHMAPIAFLYIDRKNRIFPVTNRGIKLKSVKTSAVPVAPILRNSKIMEKHSDIQLMIERLNQIPNVGALRRDNIALIDYRPTTGLTLKLSQGQELVHLGEEDIPTKGLQVLRVTDYLKSQKQKARVIDASFTKKVLVRPRKRP